MKHIVIYSTPTCAYCGRAKAFFKELGLEYKEVDLSADPTLRDELIEKYKWQTVPMIFVDDEFVGGYDDLVAYHAEGKL